LTTTRHDRQNYTHIIDIDNNISADGDFLCNLDYHDNKGSGHDKAATQR